MRAGIVIIGAGLAVAIGAAVGCAQDDCELNPKLRCGPYETTGNGGNGTGGVGATGGGGATTPSVGGGGSDPCGGCGGQAPHCMGTECVGCLDHAHCTNPDNAKCDPDTNTCVACDDSTQCAGIAGAEVCDGGACVECALSDESACDTGAGETCDLLAKECVAVGPESVTNCGACTNDLQCATGHKCIPMEFPTGTAHGSYCLREYPPACDKPFAVPLNGRASISGAAPANYCGVNEDLATCEVVLALENDWRCSGTDGMCSPDGIAPEVAVPGALCRDLGGGALANRCTYECGNASQCLDPTQSPAQSTCGTGTPPGAQPQWCGG